MAPAWSCGPRWSCMACSSWRDRCCAAVCSRCLSAIWTTSRPGWKEPTRCLEPGPGRSEMQTIKEAAADFLAGKRVAVTGVSRKPQGHGSNVVYQRLGQRGYQVFAVNPNADQVEGDTCYRDLKSIPGGVDWVVIGTKPETAEATMRECADLGITHVWMHRGPGAGSVSEAATEYGRQHGIKVIAGGCPCMFDPTADAGHKAMRFMFTLTDNVPKRV